MCAEARDSGRWTTERRHQPFQSSNKYCSLCQWVRENERRSGNTSQFSLVVSTVLFECMYGQYEYLHDDEIACLNFVTAWSRQQGRRSVKGPDTFRLSSFVVGSNVRAIVSLGLARKYIYGREICLLSVGPPSLNSGRPDRNEHVRPSHRRCSNSKWAPRPWKVPGLSLVSDSYLVDDASSHMLVSKIKPCMSKYKPH